MSASPAAGSRSRLKNHAEEPSISLQPSDGHPRIGAGLEDLGVERIEGSKRRAVGCAQVEHTLQLDLWRCSMRFDKAYGGCSVHKLARGVVNEGSQGI